MKHLSGICVSLLLLPAFAQADLVYKETFDGLYRDEAVQQGNNSRYNNRDVRWNADVRARIRDLQDVAGIAGLEGVRSVTNSAISAADVPNRGGNTADGVLHFTFPEGQNSFAEQRFFLAPSALGGRDGVTELWIQYDQYIPTNFRERSFSGSSGSKVLALFNDSYDNTRLILGRLPTGSVGSAIHKSDWRFFDSSGGRQYNVYRDRDRPLIDMRIDSGTWQRRTVHVILPTGIESNNGITEFWVRHGDGSTDKLIDDRDGSFYSLNGTNYIANGYFLGWSNPGFSESTSILIDNVIIAESPEHLDQTAFSAPEPRPNPPVLR